MRIASLSVALLLHLSALAAAATEGPTPVAGGPAPPAEAPADYLQEVVVEEREPRYVAPTRRDQIGRIWAPVVINGQGPYRLVLDTGSNRSAVNAGVAAKLGIPLTAENQVLLHGVTGSRTVPTISIESLVVGDLELLEQRLPIVTDALGGAEGVLGTEGLLDKRIVIDFRRDRIRILRSRSEHAPRGYMTIPVIIDKGLLLVANVRVGSVRAKAIIDTGAQSTIANAAFRQALVRRTRAEDVRTNEITGTTLDVQSGELVLAPPITIGDLLIDPAYVTFGDMYIFNYWKMTKTPALMIGMDVLGQFDTLIIDYKRRELQVLMRKPRR